MFRRWRHLLPDDVELVLVTMPGRERRVAELPLDHYPTAMKHLTEHLGEVLRTPYALFGHSMGALLALGLAAFQEEAGRPPSRLLVSGCPAPGTRNDRNAREWTDAELIDELRRHGGTAPEILNSPELLELVLPLYRADLAVCDSFRPPPKPLTTPISVLGGDRDVGTEALEPWRDWSRAEVVIRVFPGGHFFVNGEAEQAVIGSVIADLSPSPRLPLAERRR